MVMDGGVGIFEDSVPKFGDNWFRDGLVKRKIMNLKNTTGVLHSSRTIKIHKWI